MKKTIKKIINFSLKNLQERKIFPKIKNISFEIEYPKEKKYGDYATNLALILAKEIKKEPLKIAKLIASEIQNSNFSFFEKIEIANPGFINFFLSKEYLQKKLIEILKKKEDFFQLKIGKGKKIQIEFISANPTGPLHIGHARGAFFGDTLARVFKKGSFKVIKEYYINNAKVNNQIKLLGKTAVGEGTAYLNEYLKRKIEKFQSKILEFQSKITDKEKLYSEVGYFLAQEIQKDNKFFIEEKLKIKFDNWFSEESLYQKSKIKKIFNWLKEKKLIYQKEGAWWIKTSLFGDKKDWVIIKSEKGGKTPTYLLSDIAYHQDKFERKFKRIINIWGADHQAHVAKIRAIAKMLKYKGKLDILISQIVNLKGEKISKRKGKIITLEELIEMVGLDVARFFYLTKSLSTQMEFDLNKAKKEGKENPVFYIQYAFARISGILRKIQIKEMKIRKKEIKLLNHPKEIELMKELIKLPQIIEDTIKDYQVQRIPQYAFNLATLFHQFYQDCQVLTENLPLKRARLGLVLATKIILKGTLDLLGISAPERM